MAPRPDLSANVPIPTRRSQHASVQLEAPSLDSQQAQPNLASLPGTQEFAFLYSPGQSAAQLTLQVDTSDAPALSSIAETQPLGAPASNAAMAQGPIALAGKMGPTSARASFDTQPHADAQHDTPLPLLPAISPRPTLTDAGPHADKRVESAFQPSQFTEDTRSLPAGAHQGAQEISALLTPWPGTGQQGDATQQQPPCHKALYPPQSAQTPCQCSGPEPVAGPPKPTAPQTQPQPQGPMLVLPPPTGHHTQPPHTQDPSVHAPSHCHESTIDDVSIESRIGTPQTSAEAAGGRPFHPFRDTGQQPDSVTLLPGTAGPSHAPWAGGGAGGSSAWPSAQAAQAQSVSGAAQGRRGGLVHELVQLLVLALPCVVITGSAQVVVVASQVLAGHLGTESLAAAALGNMLWLLGYYSIIGTCTALETLGAQAVGAGDYGRLVVWDMTALTTTTLLALPFAGALWNADSLAQSLLGQDPAFCQVLVGYCRNLVPGMLPAVWSIIISKHLQVQSQVLVPALVVGSAAAVYVGVAWPMVTEHGLEGVAMAASVARAYQLLAMLSALLVYESCQGVRWMRGSLWMRGVARWRAARRGKTLAKFLSLGAPGCLAAVLECVGWEVTTAMAAYLGTLQVAVHSSALSIATLVIMCVPMALAIATNIRVARLLGSGQAAKAQTCARLAVTLGTLLTSALGVVLYAFRHQLGWAFTYDDTAIVDLLARIAPLVAVYQAVAGLLGSTQGVLRGLGRQGILVVHNSMGLGVGTMLGAWLTWGPRQMGLPGLWAGSVVGTAVTASLNGLLLFLVDWQYEVQRARNVQQLQQGVRARQQMIYRALKVEDSPDEALVEALLAEAQQDPRPLHIIYQEYAWYRGNASMASTSVALSRAQSMSGV